MRAIMRILAMQQGCIFFPKLILLTLVISSGHFNTVIAMHLKSRCPGSPDTASYFSFVAKI